jgi:hypothetical protein
VHKTASKGDPWEIIKSREVIVRELGGQFVAMILKNQEKIKPSDMKILKQGLKEEKEKLFVQNLNFSKDPFLRLL